MPRRPDSGKTGSPARPSGGARRDRSIPAPPRGVGLRAVRRRELRLRHHGRHRGRRAVPHRARRGRGRPGRPGLGAAAVAAGRVAVRVRRQPVGAAAGRSRCRSSARWPTGPRPSGGCWCCRRRSARPPRSRWRWCRRAGRAARPARLRRRQRRVRRGDPGLQRLPRPTSPSCPTATACPARGFAFGYAGGAFVLAVSLALVTAAEPLGISRGTAVRLAIGLSARLVGRHRDGRGAAAGRRARAARLRRHAGDRARCASRSRGSLRQLQRLPRARCGRCPARRATCWRSCCSTTRSRPSSRCRRSCSRRSCSSRRACRATTPRRSCSS